VKRYELHYQKKKVKVGDEVLSAQFGYITFHPNLYGDHVKLTPYVKNKWSAS
jgi:regulatory protein YycI of two-component signal transduction system YycFG